MVRVSVVGKPRRHPRPIAYVCVSFEVADANCVAAGGRLRSDGGRVAQPARQAASGQGRRGNVTADLVAGQQHLRVSTLLVHSLEVRNIPRGPLPTAQAIVVLSSDAEPAIPPQPTVWVDDSTANRLLFAVKLYREAKRRRW